MSKYTIKYVFIILCICITIVVGLVLYEGAILIKPFFGAAQILKKTEFVVYNENGRIPDSKVFKMNTIQDGKTTNRYVVWNSGSKNDVIIIDLNEKKVGRPNSGTGYYKNIFNMYLIQSSGSDRFIPFSDGVKGWDFDPELIINENEIEFKTPDTKYYPNKLVKLKMEN